MMTTMHAVLRDRYHRRQLTADVVQLLAATVVVSTAFLDAEIARMFGLDALEMRLGSGTAGIVVFALGIVSLRVNWSEKSARHGQAAERLAELKSRLRTLSASEPSDAELGQHFEVADVLMRELPPIPDKIFLKLKAKHKLKVAISREIDNSPGLPLFLLRWRLLRGSPTRPGNTPSE